MTNVTEDVIILPQVRIFNSFAHAVKLEKIPVGHFGLYSSNDEIVDLGKSFNCLVAASRERASCVNREPIITCYGTLDTEANSKTFKIMEHGALSGVRGFLAGHEYLLWLPKVKSWVTFFMGTVVLRAVSECYTFQSKSVTVFTTEHVVTRLHDWYTCSIVDAESIFDTSNIPNYSEQLHLFHSPKDEVS